jgi:predicted S18 family serine protease
MEDETMKKLLAIVLVLMLLTASAAFAETATVVTYANPVVSVTQDGQTQTIDLAGLEVTLSMGLVGEEPQPTRRTHNV